MELKDHLTVLGRARWLIIVVTVLVVGVAVVWTFVRPTVFDASVAFAVNRINKEKTAEYQYDGYYSIQAADLFSQTVVSWFMTPSVLLEIYDRAGIDPQVRSLDSFTRRFKTRQYSAQNIVVKFMERDQQSAEKIAAAITTTMEEKATQLNQTADKQALFEIVGSKPVIVESKLNLYLVCIVSFISGLLLSIIIVYLKEYFREEQVS